MTAVLLLALPGNEAMTAALAQKLGAEVGEADVRAFPDGETYLRFLTDLPGRSLVLVGTLDHPNEKLLPLLFAASTARELGAIGVGLVAPYLGYMRQDCRFKPGEAVTSREFARLLSEAFDWLITVDPHLHRYRSLDEIYCIPTRVAHAAPLIAEWIRANVARPLLVGPDRESEQWISAVAKDVGAPYAVLDKIRHGDREVEISSGTLQALDADATPVVIDDVIASGRTMLEAIRAVVAHGGRNPVCAAVHGLFADASDVLLTQAGARVATSNTIPHATNRIDVSGLLADAVRELALPSDSGWMAAGS
jgi:ribose-phosphate pyrophosphokinase